MIVIIFMLGSIKGLFYQYSQPGVILGADELYRLDLLPKIENFDYNASIYYIDSINYHKYGLIIDSAQLFNESSCTTFIWLLSRINSTIYVKQLLWENQKISSVLFQRTNKQLECYQIQMLDNQLLLDCRENNIDCFYFVELNSQTYFKYNLQQVNYYGKRKCMVIEERKKIFIIRGNITQAYSFGSGMKPHLLYQKIVNFDTFNLEWSDHLSDILYQIDNNIEVNMGQEFQNKIHLQDNNGIIQNDQRALQLCDPLLQNCFDLITLDKILDLQQNHLYFMFKAEDFIYFYHYNLQNSTKINFSGKVEFNPNLNQLMVIDDSKMILYYIDQQLINFVKVERGSLLIQQNHSTMITQLNQNDISMLIKKTQDEIIISQIEFQLELRKNFPFIGGSLQYEFDQQFYDSKIKYLQFYDELHCQQVFLINFYYNYYFYCLVNDQLHVFAQNKKNGFMQVQSKQIKGMIVQIYTYDNKICINVFTNLTQITCYQFSQPDEYFIEFAQKGISFQYDSFLWLSDSNLYILSNNLVKIISLDKPQKVKYEQDLIIVFTQSYINVVIQFKKIKYIEKCQDFIDFICLEYYCIQICLTKIEKYALLQDNLIYCGEINLYKKVLNNQMKVTSSCSDYFYIWDAFQILIFSTYKALNQGFIATLNYLNIQSVVALNDFICIQFIESWKCYLQAIIIEIKLNENVYENTSLMLCASNYYDKQCVKLQIQYYKRLKDIKLKRQQMKILINKNQNYINLGHSFYIGNVDGIQSNSLQILSRQQTFQKFYYQRVQNSLIIWNFFIILTSDGIIFYNFLSHQLQFHHINKICRQIVPVQNHIYLMCLGYQNLIFKCSSNECQFHSYFLSPQIQNVFNIKIYENYTVTSSAQNKIIIFELYNNTVTENIIQIPQYLYYDFTLINQNLCTLIIDMDKMIQFTQNNITIQFTIHEVFEGIIEDIKSFRILSIQLIDSNGNACFKTQQSLYFFQFSIDKKPFYYGKIQYLNEKVQIKQFNDQYILMLSNYSHILIYKFKLQDLRGQIYYQIFINLISDNHSDNLIYIQNNSVVLKNTYFDHIQLKEITFDYILTFEQPIQPQKLTLTLHNDEQQIRLTLLIEFYTMDDLYFMLIICLLVSMLIIIKIKSRQNRYI